MAEQTSTKPYLTRAIYEWALDNGLTPQLLVDAERPDVSVPSDYVKDGQIVLNIHDQAVRGLVISNDQVSFSARFGGQPMDCLFPIGAIIAIFARENGQGLFFQPEENGQEGPSTDPPPGPPDGGPSADPRPRLKLVK